MLNVDFTQLCKEWDYKKNKLNPNCFTSYSNKKVWWRCKKYNHSWSAQIESRTKLKTGCPYCSNQKAMKGFNSLHDKAPDLCKEWNYEKNKEISPDFFTKGSGAKVWWKCFKNHEWKAIIKSRVFGNGCPYCSNKKVLAGYNDLTTTHPDLCKEWNHEKNKIKPIEVSFGSDKKVFWTCKKHNHVWETAIKNRACHKNSCPFCSGHKVLLGFNDLTTTHPNLCKEWNCEKNKEIQLEKISAGSNKRVWWKCSKNHEWLVSVLNRTHKDSECPECQIGRQISNVEKRLKERLCDYFNVLKNKRIYGNKKHFDVDIILEKKIIIEYDGSYWHKNKEDKDIKKNELLNALGYRVIRIRQYPLNKTSDKDIVVKGNHTNKTVDKYIDLFFEKMTKAIEKEMDIDDIKYKRQ